MRRLTWAVDGYGRRTICHHDLTDFPCGIACPVSPEHFWELMDLLEEQWSDE
ncbi:hypothetical protein YA0850_01310 [Pseudomonas veronii]|uniref:Uncharacterized protein n=1 Tax=Pseudomonas veronii TaxID=76761 RepID=A0ABS0VCD6_PSEVE|nr:hypothetical protein [Pseudomonas veronii]MBI6551063.1 hypothetical protein [Pseudomonas veronii]MBI6649161.1 hypothetical protein [Pseudomonas veronii]